MDDYTRRTKDWLDQRFNLYQNGVYVPNQPIYGFSKLKERLEEYSRSFHILRQLNRLSFESVLDVGCAEGYFAHLVSVLFEGDGFGAELSDTAVIRARELYGTGFTAADAHQLPFRDRSVDVVVCSETLEHVTDPQSVVDELLRIARCAVIVTTPAARGMKEQEDHFKQLDPNEPHAHIHYLTELEVSALFPPTARLQRIRSRWIGRLMDLIYEDNSEGYGFRKAFFDFLVTSSPLSDSHRTALQYSLLDRYRNRPFWVHWFGPRTVGALLRLDAWLSGSIPMSGQDHLVTVVLDDSSLLPRKRFPDRRLLRFLLQENKVPYLRKEQVQ